MAARARASVAGDPWVVRRMKENPSALEPRVLLLANECEAREREGACLAATGTIDLADRDRRQRVRELGPHERATVLIVQRDSRRSLRDAPALEGDIVWVEDVRVEELDRVLAEARDEEPGLAHDGRARERTVEGAGFE